MPSSLNNQTDGANQADNGIPIRRKGVVMGAIGTSAGTVEQDIQVAEAAAEWIEPSIQPASVGVSYEPRSRHLKITNFVCWIVVAMLLILIRWKRGRAVMSASLRMLNTLNDKVCL